jgi:hypothetical protein
LRYLTDKEIWFKEKVLVPRGILRKVDGRLMRHCVLGCCGDLHRAPDIKRHLKRMYTESHGGEALMYQGVQLHGGPANLAYAPPDVFPTELEREAVMRFSLYQLAIGLIAKNLDACDLVNHWPCGQLLLWNMNMYQFCSLAAYAEIAAKQKLQAMVDEEIRKARKAPMRVDRIASHCHFDYGPDKSQPMETWNFCPRLWSEQKAEIKLLFYNKDA